MFNKLKEVGGKLRERTQSIRSDSGSVSGASLGSGFLCPDCKQSFGESDQLQSHWLVCLSRSVSLIDISLPEEDNLDLEAMGLEELKNLITETKIDSRKLQASNQEIVRKAGAMAMEVGKLQKEIDDVTAKSANYEEMSLVLQETYLAQVKRNEELRELLEQRSMGSPDDIQVLTRELTRLHAILSEKEGEWETRLSQLSGEKSQNQSADLSRSKRETEECQRELVASQLEAKAREHEAGKLANQVGALTEARDQLTEQVTNQRAEISRLAIEKECSQSNADIATQLERCLTAVSADKQELFEKIGTEALSGALSDTFVQQIQSDLAESRASLRQERESAARREEQLTNRHQTELRERDTQMSELRSKVDSMREGNDLLKTKVSEGDKRETELTNQLQAAEGQLGAANERTAEKEVRVSGLQAELRGAREEFARGREDQLTEVSDRERQLRQEQSKARDLELELETARTDFVELNRLIDEKESDLARTLGRAEKSEEDLSNTLELKNSLSSQILEMDCTIQELGQQLEEKSLSCSEQKREIAGLAEDRDQLGEQLEAGRDSIKKQSEEHGSVKSLLIEQKLSLQSQLALAEGKTRGMESQLSAERREKESSQLTLQREVQLATERGDRLSGESAETREQLEKEKTLAQLTRTNLQQEISSLRDDVRAGGTERAGLQERLDIQFGRMAVLDAKLQSLRDENHRLVGAQTERDSSIAAAKQRVHDLEVELGDSKSALYELAQENQKQTLKEAKVADRKWQDDTLAGGCSGCNKKFSLSVRKHHCRRCGQIFCQECTQGQADLPSYKGKVRVCDACIRDLDN